MAAIERKMMRVVLKNDANELLAQIRFLPEKDLQEKPCLDYLHSMKNDTGDV